MLKIRLFFAFLFLSVSFSFARVDDYIAEVEIIKGLLNESLTLYKDGKANEAKKKVEDAYFQHFENMEGAIGRNIGRKAITMERKFSNLRRMYKDEANVDHINALIEGLIFDLDEVAPVIQTGFRLEAEKTQDGLSDEEIAKSSLEENAKRQAEADALFASMFGETAPSDENLASTSLNSQNANKIDNENNSNNLNSQNDADVITQLQSASALEPKLQFLLDTISGKFNQAASSFKNKKFQEAKDYLNSALFDEYRNSKVEIAISNHTTAGLDRKIQAAIRSLITKINEQNIDEKTLRNELENIEDLLFDAFLQIPKEQFAKIQVQGFNEEQMNARDYSKVADDIRIALDDILDDYQGFSSSSIDALQNAYLDTFEASGMESKVGAVDSNLKLKIESLFSQGVALIKSSADKTALKANFDALNAELSKAVDLVQTSTPYSIFIWAFSIIIREGLEALIIVVAIVSYLIQSGNKNRLNIVYSALLAGIVLSFITAFFVSWIFKENSGQSRELIEGITMLIAVVLLFYVGFWLLSNAHNQKWANYIKGQALEAISNNSAKTLWLTVFLAVYREGAETVLFYQALFFDAKTSTDYSAIFIGLGVGLALLVVLYFLLKAGAIKIPVKQFFYIVSYIIFYMVFVFTGKGIGELIEGKLITPSLLPINFEPVLWLGVYPYYETLIPQFIVLILLILGIVITQKFTKKGVR
ncbi:FTR1 family iron permease [Campylobacter sp. MIT 97-5078]|uniref:FTR1 family iron permease n=1 Tax=Campylobacter sp. MIT 97-5078 TaxID=1548153 RepID=UPI000513B1DA|nr:FTR1 family protein [Campylobacter sp. MIT 97-5078]KGI56110.1 iron permease [Campylobacter sp. MIT 97-5078]KGI57109.1 iron permease [Campylobacter sp. MIT 97-5078]TQR25471.1 iron permease [Campylobacter sp. MIT 97-5078]